MELIPIYLSINPKATFRDFSKWLKSLSETEKVRYLTFMKGLKNGNR